MTDSDTAQGWRAAAGRAAVAVRQGRYGDAATEASSALALARDARRIDHWDRAAADAVEIYRLAGLSSRAASVVNELCDRDPGATPGPSMARALASITTLLQRPDEAIAYRLVGLGSEDAPEWSVDDHLAQARCHLDLSQIVPASLCIDRAAALRKPESGSAIAVARAELALAAADLSTAAAESGRALRLAEPHTHEANHACVMGAEVHAASQRPGEVLALLAGSAATSAGRRTIRLARGTWLDAALLVRHHRLVADACESMGDWPEAVVALEDLRAAIAIDRINAATIVELEQRLALVAPTVDVTDTRRETIELSRLIESDERSLSIVSSEVSQRLDQVLDIADQFAEAGTVSSRELDQTDALLTAIKLSIDDLEAIAISGPSLERLGRGQAPVSADRVIAAAFESVAPVAASVGVELRFTRSTSGMPPLLDPDAIYVLSALIRTLLAVTGGAASVEVHTDRVAAEREHERDETGQVALRLSTRTARSVEVDHLARAVAAPHLQWTAVPIEFDKAAIPACLAVAQRVLNHIGGRIDLQVRHLDGVGLRQVDLAMVIPVAQVDDGH